MSNPPEAKYRLTLTITGNSHDEITSELGYAANGGYLLASDYEHRDAFDSTGGRDRMVLEHVNPDMTPERYAAELDAWWTARKANRSGPDAIQAAREELDMTTDATDEGDAA